MDTTLLQRLNAFFLAAVLLAGPVLLVAMVWVAGSPRSDAAAAPLQPTSQTAHQP